MNAEIKRGGRFRSLASKAISVLEPQIILGIAVAVLIFLPGFVRLSSGAGEYRSQIHPHYGERVRTTVASSLCTSKTGHFLVHCVDEHGLCTHHPKSMRLEPVENVWLPDDRGKMLFTSALTYLGLGPVDDKGLVRINLTLNAFGLATVTALFFRMGLGWFSALLMLAGSLVLFPDGSATGFWGDPLNIKEHILGPDHVAAYVGNSLSVLAALTLIASRIGGGTVRLSGGIHLALIFFLLSTTVAFRQSIGLAGVAGGVLLCLYGLTQAFRRRKNHSVKGTMVLLLVVVSSTQLTRFALELRNLALPQFRGVNMMRDHGVSHPVLLALGCRPDNPFGLRWLDSYGHKLALAENPSVVINTEDYSWVLTKVLYKKLWAHPGWAVQSYAGNLARGLEVVLQRKMQSLEWFLILGLFGMSFYSIRMAQGSWRLALTAITLAFAATFASSGIFVCASPVWLHPSRFLLLILCLAQLSFWLGRFQPKPDTDIV